LLLVIFPRLGKKTSSLLYFNGISNQTEEEFKKRIERLSEKEIDELFIAQIYANAKIAGKKFLWLKVAIIFIVLNIITSMFWLFCNTR
jgi:hypothetical protein